MIPYTTPPGTRDLIREEYQTKRCLEKQLMEVFERWGYEAIMTPMLEYYQTFSLAQMKDEEMYKILDPSNRILTLRSDMTIPIARVAAGKYKDSAMPLRFCYSANVFRQTETMRGKQNERTECGVELLGVGALDGDLEILSCALDALSLLQAKRYTLEIGDRGFFCTACELLALDQEVVKHLGELINRKSLKELNDYVDALSLEDDKKQFFKRLPWLCGNADILQEARRYAFDSSLQDILKALMRLCEALKQLGFADALSIDLGKIPRMEYYTGIIFEAFVEGVGESVLSGGRYDRLCARFGKEMEAVGFAIRLDALLPLFTPQNDQRIIQMHYPPQLQLEALRQAAELRRNHIVRCDPDPACSDIIIREVPSCYR